MTNKLCEAGCLGFPTSGSSEPFWPVYCHGGDLAVQSPRTTHRWRGGAQDYWPSVGFAVGQSINGGYIQPSFVNPYDTKVDVIANMEIFAEVSVSDDDHWQLWLDINAQGQARLYTGQQTGQWMVIKEDGTVSGQQDNKVRQLHRQVAVTMLYEADPHSTFSLGMLSRFVFAGGNPAFRSIQGLGTSMTVSFSPRP